MVEHSPLARMHGDIRGTPGVQCFDRPGPGLVILAFLDIALGPKYVSVCRRSVDAYAIGSISEFRSYNDILASIPRSNSRVSSDYHISPATPVAKGDDLDFLYATTTGEQILLPRTDLEIWLGDGNTVCG